MSSSAINTQVAQLKVGNVQNQADSTSIYSNGVWSFKNSTALTSVTITDAGAVTLGPSGFTGNHVVNGNVGIGTASPRALVEASTASETNVGVFGRSGLSQQTIQTDSTINLLGGQADGNGPSIVFNHLNVSNGASTGKGARIVGFRNNAGNDRAMGIDFKYADGNGTTQQAMRIDASGNLLVGTTDASPTSGIGMKLLYGSANMVSVVANYNANIAHFYLYNLSATNNGARFAVNTNGGISNYSANNSNLSDERVKTDISLASSYLEKICSIPVKTFRYKDQGDDMDLTLGVIAQDVEKVAPELVNTTDGFGDLPEDGVPLKTVYQTDIQYALMKCIQELKEKNDALEARLAALEAKP